MEKLSAMADVKIVEGFPVSNNDGNDGQEPAGSNPGSADRHDGYICSLTFEDDTAVSVFNGGRLLEQVEKLCGITDLYLHTSYSDRVSYTKLASLKHNYPDFRTLLTFRPFNKHELLEVVLSGKKLPAGITRVLLPKRALGLNISLELLKSSLTLEEKNHRLAEIIDELVANKSIRFYQEPTFVFDE